MNQSNEMMRILVTGAAGFIGSHVVRDLAAHGHHVVALDQLEIGADLPATRVVRCNIRSDPFPAGPFDVVVHLAALGGVRTSMERPGDYHATNVIGTRRLLDWSAANGCLRVLFASSSSVYGATDGRPSVETDPLAPLSPYAATKLAGERLGRGFADERRAFTALRFFTVWGDGQRPDLALALFRRKLLAGEPLTILGDGSQRRDLTHVDDVARAIRLAACRRDAGFRVYNIGTGRNHSVLEMVGALERRLGRVADLRFVPGHPADVPWTLADASLAAADLGWRARVRFTDGSSATDSVRLDAGA